MQSWADHKNTCISVYRFITSECNMIRYHKRKQNNALEHFQAIPRHQVKINLNTN